MPSEEQDANMKLILYFKSPNYQRFTPYHVYHRSIIHLYAHYFQNKTGRRRSPNMWSII